MVKQEITFCLILIAWPITLLSVPKNQQITCKMSHRKRVEESNGKLHTFDWFNKLEKKGTKG